MFKAWDASSASNCSAPETGSDAFLLNLFVGKLSNLIFVLFSSQLALEKLLLRPPAVINDQICSLLIMKNLYLEPSGGTPALYTSDGCFSDKAGLQ